MEKNGEIALKVRACERWNILTFVFLQNSQHVIFRLFCIYRIYCVKIANFAKYSFRLEFQLENLITSLEQEKESERLSENLSQALIMIDELSLKSQLLN